MVYQQFKKNIAEQVSEAFGMFIARFFYITNNTFGLSHIFG